MGVQLGGGGMEEKVKRLMDTDNGVVIAGGEGSIKVINGNRKKYNKKSIFYPWLVWLSG